MSSNGGERMDPKEFYLICKNTKDRFQIPEGETTIGRGPFLKVKDKRVSRAHAIISLQSGSLKVKPIHTNPTFFWNGNGKCIILKQNVWQNLNDADTISLLPSDLLFSVGIKHHADINSNQKESVLSKDHSTENRPTDRITDYKDTIGNDPLPHLMIRNEGKASKIDELIEQVHEGTFEDSIDSLENEEFDVKVLHASLDKDTKSESKTEDESCHRKKDENEPRTSNAKSGLMVSPARVAADKSMKEKKRILPSWMLESSPAKNTARRKKTTSASKRKTSEDKIEMNDGMSLERNADAAKGVASRAAPRAKRTKQENNVLGDVVDSCCKDSKPNQKGSKSSKEDECRLRNSEDRTITPEAGNTSTFETKNVGTMLGDRGEQLQHSPRDNDPQTSTQAGRRTSDEGSQRLLEEAQRNEYIRKPNEEVSQSTSMPDGSASAEGDSTGKPKETKSKLPRCKYGKSCYRKNPVHFQEYSHSDHESDAKDSSETAADDRPECPYGINCYRRNRQHKSEYKHTMVPPNKGHTRKSRLRSRSRKSVPSDDSDDDGADIESESISSYDDAVDFESGSTTSYEDDDDDWSPEDLN